MRKITVICAIFCILMLAVGCAAKSESPVPATYVYENEGFGGDFTVTLKVDGSFEYYEGPLSSYIGCGKYSVDGDTVTITDDAVAKNIFRSDGDRLIWIADGSSNFFNVHLDDGAVFKKRCRKPKGSAS